MVSLSSHPTSSSLSQDDHSSDPLGDGLRAVTIHFVQDGPPESWSASFSDAYKAVNESPQFHPSYIRLIDSNNLLAALQRPSQRKQVLGVYILNSLEGELFDLLKGWSLEVSKSASKRSDHATLHHCRIFSPLAIVDCINKNSPLPLRPWPVASATFLKQSFVIASSKNCPEETKFDLRDKIRLMGGDLARNPREATVLISEHLLTKKAIVLKDLKKERIKIVTRDLVDRCWKSCQDGITISPEDLNRLALKCATPSVFDGVEFCVSHLSSKSMADEVIKVVKQIDAYFSRALSPHTSYLVAESVEKLHHARLAINKAKDCHADPVTLDWIRECIINGRVGQLPSSPPPQDENQHSRKSTNQNTLPSLGFQIVHRLSRPSIPSPSRKLAKIMSQADNVLNDQDMLSLWQPSRSKSGEESYSQILDSDVPTQKLDDSNSAQDDHSTLSSSSQAPAYAMRVHASASSQTASCLMSVRANAKQYTNNYEGILSATKKDMRNKTNNVPYFF